MSPDEYTLEEKMIAVSDGHILYAQLWGNDKAKETIVFLHGGPGGGTSNYHKSLFDPLTQRVIFFDQRGCGRSTPHGSLVSNTTDDSVGDITVVTKAFGAEQLILAGGSWGSCLALVYAIRYPERVTRMVLRGIFTGRRSEIDFINKGEFKDFFPDIWADFVASAPKEYAQDPSSYHLPRVVSEDAEAAKLSAYAFDKLEGSLISLDDRHFPTAYDTFDPVPTIIECYFLDQQCFLPDNYIMDNAAKLTMPIALIQGRYDMVCPPITAYELNSKLPNAQLYWTTAGHSGNDRPNWDLARTLLQN